MESMKLKRALAGAAALMMILSGCSNTSISQSGKGQEDSDQSSVAVVAIDAVMPAIPAGLEEFYNQKIEWKDCSGLECAT
ncbi:MAG: hypothetical protein SPG61_00515, partial [Arcanobacterium sp.]|nr:hypothetical protein [Arcanobacterium sp.]